MNGLGSGTGSAGLSGVGTGSAGLSLNSGIFRFEIVILNFSFGRLNTVSHVSRYKSVTITGPG